MLSGLVTTLKVLYKESIVTVDRPLFKQRKVTAMASIGHNYPPPFPVITAKVRKDLALIRDILSSACGRVFWHTTLVVNFISDRSANMAADKRQQRGNYCCNFRQKQLRANNSSTGLR